MVLEGVEQKPLKFHLDDRGYVYEIVRHTDEIFRAGEFRQLTFSHLFPGAIKAFHFHRKQTDWVACVQGNVRLVLADFREFWNDGKGIEGRESLLRQKVVPKQFFLGEKNPVFLRIPKGIWHGYCALGHQPASIMYVTDQVYDPSDEYRVPWDFFGKELWEIQNK
ncbi:MAG: dTDP-4-dehydrorhamnose 3,5-epimerase family protein [Candidatus Diapherotrites archaeon]|nr:dTDP-4-dehydrorhamnose 3,5-epimerase family protein [Candidatus Diapherotrites archaeon]